MYVAVSTYLCSLDIYTPVRRREIPKWTDGFLRVDGSASGPETNLCVYINTNYGNKNYSGTQTHKKLVDIKENGKRNTVKAKQG